jgi:SAM-dependent methyltransferase
MALPLVISLNGIIEAKNNPIATTTTTIDVGAITDTPSSLSQLQQQQQEEVIITGEVVSRRRHGGVTFFGIKSMNNNNVKQVVFQRTYMKEEYEWRCSILMVGGHATFTCTIVTLPKPSDDHTTTPTPLQQTSSSSTSISSNEYVALVVRLDRCHADPAGVHRIIECVESKHMNVIEAQHAICCRDTNEIEYLVQLLTRVNRSKVANVSTSASPADGIMTSSSSPIDIITKDNATLSVTARRRLSRQQIGSRSIDKPREQQSMSSDEYELRQHTIRLSRLCGGQTEVAPIRQRLSRLTPLDGAILTKFSSLCSIYPLTSSIIPSSMTDNDYIRYEPSTNLPTGMDEAKESERLHYCTSRKRPQIAWLIHQLNCLFINNCDYKTGHLSSKASRKQKYHVIDIGCGRGDLAINMAAYWSSTSSSIPTVRVTAIDRNEPSLIAGRQRALELNLINITFLCDDVSSSEASTSTPVTEDVISDNKVSMPTPKGQSSFDWDALLSSSSSSSSELEEQEQVILVGLHACGGLTDVIMDLSIKYGLPFIVVPCCYCHHSHLRPSFTTSLPLPSSVSSNSSVVMLAAKKTMTEVSSISLTRDEHNALWRMAELNEKNPSASQRAMHIDNTLRLIRWQYLINEKKALMPTTVTLPRLLSFPIDFSPKNHVIVGMLQKY